MVDPDNRRAVDYGILRTAVDGSGQNQTSNPKWVLTNKLLKLRKEHSSLFQEGSYVPLMASAMAEKICAFRREADGKAVVVAVALHQARPRDWNGIELTGQPEAAWRSALTGRRMTGALRAAEVFRDARFEVLLRE